MESFDRIRNGQRAPSVVDALFPGWAPLPTSADLSERLATLDVQAVAAEARDDESARVTWASGAASVVPMDIGDAPLEHLTADLTDEQREAVRNATFGVRLETTWRGPVLDAFVEQLRCARQLCPEAIALYDVSALSWHAPSWWDNAIEGRVPPPPTSLFTIHAVSDEGLCWLHTHGLWRCGSIELEMLDIPVESASSMAELINVAAGLMIEEGVPDPGEMFAVGQDLELAWIPWQEALSTLPGGPLGREEDREHHDGARGVLVVPKRRKLGLFGSRWSTPLNLLPIADDNPLLWISSMETRRMSALAIERFPTFARLQGTFGKSGHEDEWQFLVKLGYSTDHPTDDGQTRTEHLWFDVHGIDRGQIDATLINQPFEIERMNQGDRDHHAIDQLSDWLVNSPWGSFRPDRIGTLLDQLEG